MFDWCKKVAASSVFHNFILVVILVNAVQVGVETYPQWADVPILNAVELCIQLIFVVEVTIRLLAFAPGFHRFFRDGWNVFDFTVVVMSFLPAIGSFATVARLARVLRVARLVEYSPQLRLIIDTMLRSIPSMGHVTLLMGMLLYVYAVLGVHLFRGINADTQRDWDNLGAGLWTMFHTLTFENWVAVQKPITEAFGWGWLFFFSFIIIGIFMGLNLFIAVIMNNLDEVKAEHAAAEQLAHGDHQTLKDRVNSMKVLLADLEAALDADEMKRAQRPANGQPQRQGVLDKS